MAQEVLALLAVMCMIAKCCILASASVALFCCTCYRQRMPPCTLENQGLELLRAVSIKPDTIYKP